MTTTLALIDKYPIPRTGLALYLKSELRDVQVLHAENITELKKGNSNLNPNLLILGVNRAPENDSMALLQSVKDSYSNARVIIFDEDTKQSSAGYDNAWQLLRAGANGYITKLNDVEDLITCISDVMMGKRYVSDNAFIGMAEVEKKPVKRSGPKIGLLSNRESEIAEYLLKGMSTSAISIKLDRKPSTISTIKASIFRKLKIDHVLHLGEVFKVNG